MDLRANAQKPAWRRGGILAFFDKEYILILQRYQLHSASTITQYPNGITDAYSQKIKKNYKKKKSAISDLGGS
jgi:hypothetical protein